MSLTWDDIYKGALLLNLCITLGLAVLQLWLRDKFIPRKEFEATVKLLDGGLENQGQAITQLGTKVALLEQELRHLPTADDLKQLTAAVAAVQRDQAATTATLGAVEASTKRIEGYLLQGKS